MDTRTFATFIQVSQYVGTCIANPLNVFLIYLILTKSPKKVGNYKYLMIYVAVFEIIFSVIAIITEPFIHSFTTRVIVLVKVRGSIFNRETCFLLDCREYLQHSLFEMRTSGLMCAFYGSSMTVFSIHFLYRYASLHTSARKWFESWKLFLWMMIPQFLAVVWFVMYYLFLGPTPEFTEFIRQDLFDDFDIDVDDVTYVGPYYYPQDKQGIHELDWTAFWVMTVVWIMVGVSAIAVFVGGYGCYTKISSGLAMSSNSAQSKNIQKQLFNALVMQASIPFLLMYLPTTVVLFCTFIRQNIGSTSLFISYSVAVYPAIDPLPTILIIKNYRNATYDILMRFCLCKRKAQKSQNNSSNIRMQQMQASGI